MTTEVKNAAKEVRYPKEVYSALTTDKVLSVTAHLLPVEVDGGNSPYKIYQPGKSRFVFSIINTKEKTFPTGNIRIDEIAGILANTKAAHQIDVFAKLPVLHQLFDGIKTVNKMVKGLQDAFKLLYRFVRTGQTSPVQETKKVEVNENSLAKTVMIGNGKMKGKTPFQVISESTEVQKAIFDLETQYKWLEKNLAQYPDNAVQMSAIKEALKLYQTGEVHPSDQSIGEKLNFGTIAIYEPTPRALIREKDEDGFCPVYEIAINWHVAERYPVEIRVKRPIVGETRSKEHGKHGEKDACKNKCHAPRHATRNKACKKAWQEGWQREHARRLHAQFSPAKECVNRIRQSCAICPKRM